MLPFLFWNNISLGLSECLVIDYLLVLVLNLIDQLVKLTVKANYISQLLVEIFSKLIIKC